MSSSRSPSKTIVVFGATGNIGVSLIQTLSGYNTDRSTEAFNVIALSRNPDSRASKKLAALPGVRVLRVPDNNMDQPLPTLSAAGIKKGEVYGVFSVQGYVSYKQDVAQGKAIADAAKALGVQHFVYLSTDFGKAQTTGSDVFERKRVVENYIRTLDLPFTFLRPVQFMDNLLPTAPSFLRLGRTMLIHNTFKSHPERKHQMVSTLDIGRAGALAFREPESWRNREFKLAGDEFTMPELQKIYREAMGADVDTANSWLTGFARAVVPPAKKVADFFDKTGYSVDIEQCRKELPGVENLRTFLERFKAEQSRE